jgi:hypothetical protein
VQSAVEPGDWRFSQPVGMAGLSRTEQGVILAANAAPPSTRYPT